MGGTREGTWRPPERRRCGYVFQDYALFPHLSAWRNVAYGLRGLLGASGERRRWRCWSGSGWRSSPTARPATLSGGERQRVALARALAPRPAALLLDEPLSALDARTRASASRELSEILRPLDIPVVLVTHDFHEAALLGDEVGVIDEGRIVQRGSASELAAAPATSFRRRLHRAPSCSPERSGPTDGELTVVDLDGGGRGQHDGPGARTSRAERLSVGDHPQPTLRRTPMSQPRTDSPPASSRSRVWETEFGSASPRASRWSPRSPAEAVDELQLDVGSEVVASWKATATRLIAL